MIFKPHSKQTIFFVVFFAFYLFSVAQNNEIKTKDIPSFCFSKKEGNYLWRDGKVEINKDPSATKLFINDPASLPFDVSKIIPKNYIYGHAVLNEQTRSYAIISRSLFGQRLSIVVVDSNLNPKSLVFSASNTTSQVRPIGWLGGNKLIFEHFILDDFDQHMGVFVYDLKSEEREYLPINKNYLSTPIISKNNRYLIYGGTSNLPDKLHGNIDEIYLFDLSSNQEFLIYKDSSFIQNISWKKTLHVVKNNHIEKKPLLLELPWEHGITYCVTRDGNIAPTGPIGSTSTCANLGPHSYIAWDFDTPNNSQEKILAAESGVITLANFAPGSGGFSPSGYGNWVIITHSNNYRTLYAHLSAIFVSVGDTVEQGCLIGYEGTTGSSSGDHLHFEYEYPGGTSGNTYTNFKECNCIPHRAYNYTSSNSPGLCAGISETLICSNATPINCGQLYANQNNSGGSFAISSYPCAPSTDETGPEKIYSITTTSTGNITATLSNTSYSTGDVDVHILSACDENSCLARGDFAANYNNAPPGTYYIVVDGFQGDTGPYDLLVNCSDSPTSIIKSNTNHTTKVFPNPTRDLLNIVSDERIKSVELYSVNGATIIKKLFYNVTEARLNIGNINSGLYFARVTLSNDQVLNYKIKKL